MSATSSSAPGSVVPRSVLLVEDNPIVAVVLEHVLKDRTRVFRARGVAEALHLLGERAFDVVLADYGLNDGKGTTVLEQTKRLHPHALRILISGGLVPNVDSLLAKKEIEGFLEKPITWVAFDAVVARARNARRA
jgi:DNA-binding NtrC family response regulator